MVDFSKREEVKGWLRGIRPAQRRREVAIALAARAALRVLPLLAQELKVRKRLHDGVLSEHVLPCLRAVAAAWVAARYPTHSAELRAAAATAADAADYVAETAYEAAATANAAVEAAKSAAVAAAAEAAAAAATATAEADAAAYAADAFPTSVDDAADNAAPTADALLVGSGHSGAEIAAMPLWSNGAPNWARVAWRALRTALLAADEGWEVWTEWYEARLAGDAAHPLNKALEVARATIPDEIWKQGPAVVNAEIRRLIEQFDPPRDAPSQRMDLGAIEIRSASGLMAWIDEQDASTQRDFALIIAARAALRALPILSALFIESGFANPSSIVLSSLRASILPWASIRFPTLERSLTAADAAADGAALFATSRDESGLRAVPGVAAAYAAVDAYVFSLRAGGKAGSRPSAAYRSFLASAARATDLAVVAYLPSGIELGQASWSAVSADVGALAAGRSAFELSQDRLWPNGVPYEASQHWATLMTKLKDADQGWEVWFNWYQRRIEGPAMRASNNIERAYVEVPLRLWEEGPAQVNRWIKDRIAELVRPSETTDVSDSLAAPPRIPAPKPAAVEPIFKGQRLTLPKAPVDASMPGQTISAALKALAQTLAELAKDAEDQSNIDGRFVARLHDIAQAVPKKRPNQIELFRLGHDYDELSAYSGTVADSWPELVAARYMAMTRAFERTLRRFPRWLDFTREPPIANISAQDARDISRAAQVLSEVLRAPENLNVVDPVLPDALDRISAPLDLAARRREARVDPIELGMELLARDVLESVNNTLKLVAELALAAKLRAAKGTEFAGKKLRSYATEFGTHTDKSLLKISAQLGDKVGPAIVKLAKWSMRATIGGAVLQSQGPTVAAWLVQHYPQMFSWLEPFATFLH